MIICTKFLVFRCGSSVSGDAVSGLKCGVRRVDERLVNFPGFDIKCECACRLLSIGAKHED